MANDALARILAERRKRYFDEIDRDPRLANYVRGLVMAENGGHPEGILESMLNRADMRGRKSLWDEIKSGFYGPVNRGTVRPREADDFFNGAFQRVRAGSSDIGLLTDQGMRNEHKPAAGIGVQPTLVRGEYYSPMGQQGKSWADAINKELSAAQPRFVDHAPPKTGGVQVASLASQEEPGMAGAFEFFKKDPKTDPRRTASMNGGFGMSPTGTAGISGPIHTASPTPPDPRFVDQAPQPTPDAGAFKAPTMANKMGQGLAAIGEAFGKKEASDQQGLAQLAKANGEALQGAEQAQQAALMKLLERYRRA